MKTIFIADLFCGAGGGTSGMLSACDELGLETDVVAVNHWDTALETHAKNHANVRHFRENLESVWPRTIVPGGKLHLGIFAPECIHHTRARGGKPMNDQSRATAWCVVRWCEELDIENVIVENVPEFLDWGPLYPADYEVEKLRCRPIPERKGEYFKHWVKALKLRGYTVQHRVLDASHFGGVTSRKRLFVQARKGRKITWPKSTHGKTPYDTRGGARVKPLRAAREIIDWSLDGTSIFERKRPLRPNTMNRIWAGLEKFSGLPFIVPQFGSQGPRDLERPLGTITTQSRGVGLAQPFLVVLRNNCDARSLDDSVPSVCAGGTHLGLAEPFLVKFKNNSDACSVAKPLDTLTTHDVFGLAQPYLVKFYGGHDADSLDKPLGAVTANYEHFALAEPFLLPPEGIYRGNAPRDLENPMQTITSRGGGHLVQPFLLPVTHSGGEARCHDVKTPIPTITTAKRGEFALAEPYLIALEHSTGESGHPRRCRSVDETMPTITSRAGFGVVAPFLVEYYGNGDAVSLDDPLHTVTTRDRFALVQPEWIEALGIDKTQLLARLDIRFRMLQPHELAAAMGFRSDYQFAGNREAQVKQIGNAIEFHVIKALCKCALREYSQ